MKHCVLRIVTCDFSTVIYKMSRHQAGASIVTKGWRNVSDTVHFSHIITHTLLPTSFTAELLISNKHLTKCDHVISVPDTS